MARRSIVTHIVSPLFIAFGSFFVLIFVKKRPRDVEKFSVFRRLSARNGGFCELSNATSHCFRVCIIFDECFYKCEIRPEYGYARIWVEYVRFVCEKLIVVFKFRNLRSVISSIVFRKCPKRIKHILNNRRLNKSIKYDVLCRDVVLKCIYYMSCKKIDMKRTKTIVKFRSETHV